MKDYWPIASLCLVVIVGCSPVGKGHERPGASSASVPPATLRHPAKRSSTTVPSSTSKPGTTCNDVMAIVNGEPIYMQSIYKPLLEAHGLQIAEILIANTIVQQEARRRNITVSSADITAENDNAIQNILGRELPADQRRKVLENLLRKRGISHGLWNAIMRRNALLRKMVAPDVKVTDRMVRDEFISRFTERVQVRHIQLASISDAQKIIRMLKSGSDFAELARRYSTNTTTGPRGGLLPPFTRNDKTIPRAIREAAFSLTKGHTSGIVQVGENFHVLKLERRFLPAPTDYEKVKDKLRREIRERLINRKRSELLSQLRGKASIQFTNQILMRSASEFQRGR